jgi:Fungalysin metallopeptidase (M36)/Proprotein convertase P-domain/Fungalysin/Thermolysin Propeptide Motif
MIRNRSLTQLLSVSALSLAACATADDGARSATDRDQAVQELQRRAGAPVALEVGDAGDARVLAMTPGSSVPGHATDPAVAAQDFLATHHDVFQLDAADATQFAVTRVDQDRAGDLRHVTLNRTFDGIPVFQGAITVHMDAGNGVFRALGDEAYHIAAPTNRRMLSPSEAAVAAGRALGLTLSPVLAEADAQHAVFTAAGTLDPIRVTQKIVHVAQGDDRFAYQATVSWLDGQKQQQYQLALIDAQDGSLLASHSLVNTFTGRAFTAGPGAHPTTDTRQLVSFDGNPASSPQGWVGAARTTVGNNAVACTDLDRNNACGATEIQPAADANNSFDFAFDPRQDSALFKSAAVASAFFLVNDYHDRTYALGFTEAAGNFQTSNFGKGGAQADEVQVDAQDGSGTNNANFATPPDGSKPRMQMFLFNIDSSTVSNGAGTEDGDFDPGVIYHENSHGLSNRLVGGGSGGCLGSIQSGGMGEGWGDFLGASFLNDPVVGAYVTGNATVGIRRASMASSPFTYANIKDGTMTEVHNAGEIWAATLWDARNGVGGVGGVGAAVIEQLVVSGMKLTPCAPTMLQARDGIISADAAINGAGNPNQCKLWAAFANRQMGTGASSATASSTSTIVLSTAVPPECGGGGGGTVTRDLASADVPRAIPDNTATGVSSAVSVPAGVSDTVKVTVDVNITHPQRGDLVIQVISPTGQTATLSNRAGGKADNFVVSGQDISASFSAASSPSGQWRLFVQDLARRNTGTINSFALHITSSN